MSFRPVGRNLLFHNTLNTVEVWDMTISFPSFICHSVYTCPRMFLSGNHHGMTNMFRILNPSVSLKSENSCFSGPKAWLSHEIASICLANFELTEDCINYQVIDFYQNRPNISLTKMFVAMTEKWLSYLNGCIRYPYVYFFPLLIWHIKNYVKKTNFFVKEKFGRSGSKIISW